MDVSPDELPLLYTWIDGIPLSRPKRNISRDFSDAVLAAEVVAHYCPRLVDAHNYSAANGLAQKIYNWSTLNNKVFRRLHFSLTKEDIEAVASCEPQMIERILKLLKYKIAKYKPNGLSGDSDLVKDHLDGGHFHDPHSRSGGPQRDTLMISAKLEEKDALIRELSETIELLEAKVRKLEQLVRLKEHKIQVLSGKVPKFNGRA
ncbi:unnamed protein product [Sphagnum troendelagicum]|uniref:Calponin-homology (CH) domain-containing protein n=2 Tax=Sphagnum TaxID=13804 RepID=A0ABP0UN05_9BRYO